MTSCHFCVRARPVRRRTWLAALGALALPAMPGLSAAQPGDRAVRYVLPVSAGSGVDIIVRACAPALGQALGHPVIVDNQPGAGGITGALTLIKAAPDGFTLGMVSNNHVILPSIYKSLPFDPVADITPIAVLGTTPLVLVVNPRKLPATNAAQLIRLLKASPGRYNYGSSGNGTILHLGAALFVEQSGVRVQHVPYKGTGPLITDLIGGQVDFAVIALPAIQAHLQNQSLVAIGVGSVQRTPALPELPTLAEQGLPDYEINGWFAVVGPARLAAAEVARIHAAWTTASQTPEVREAMRKQGNVIDLTTPAAAAAFFRDERDKYARIVQGAGITAS